MKEASYVGLFPSQQDMSEGRALRPTCDYGDGPERRQQAAPGNSLKSARLTAKYNRLWERYLATKPGTVEARKALDELLRAPTC